MKTLPIAVGVFALSLLGEATRAQRYDDPASICASAARQAEGDWHLPEGLLAAIGLVESGRRAHAGAYPIIWPWTINAEGQGFFQPSKDAAISMVRALQRRGVRVIDVGCFQVDLFYNPYAFTSLEEAFDPEANARAAARILSLGRLGSTGWDDAIAAYHSAVPLSGVAYLQKVRAVWPWILVHPRGEQELPAVYAMLLSPQARLVRVVTPLYGSPPRFTELTPLAAGRQADKTVQWLHEPVAQLPRVLTP